MIIAITSEDALKIVRQIPGVAHDLFEVGDCATISRGDFFSSLQEVYLQHSTHVTSPTGVHNLEMRLFGTAAESTDSGSRTRFV